MKFRWFKKCENKLLTCDVIKTKVVSILSAAISGSFSWSHQKSMDLLVLNTRIRTKVRKKYFWELVINELCCQRAQIFGQKKMLPILMYLTFTFAMLFAIFKSPWIANYCVSLWKMSPIFYADNCQSSDFIVPQ